MILVIVGIYVLVVLVQYEGRNDLFLTGYGSNYPFWKCVLWPVFWLCCKFNWYHSYMVGNYCKNCNSYPELKK